MSGFFNETNYGRINKMHEMLVGPMSKSAASNKATQEQWAEMLEPLRQFIAEVCGTAQGPFTSREDTKTETVKAPSGTARRSLKDEIDELPFHELTSIITLATLRLDAAAYELAKAEKENMK